MSTEHQCGSLHFVPIGEIADRVARRILETGKPKAVTVDPEGRVWVERPQHVAECDLVGVYTRELGLLELSRRVAADLLHEKQSRFMPDKRPYRERVFRGRAKREAA